MSTESLEEYVLNVENTKDSRQKENALIVIKDGMRGLKMSNELRLKRLKDRWFEIQTIRFRIKELADKMQPMKTELRQLAQSLGTKLDEYAEVMV